MTTVNAEILFFGGTYETLWCPGEYAPTDDQGDAIDNGSVKSFKAYLDHLGTVYTEALAEELEIPDGMISFEATSSPREYNFSTNRLFVDVDLTYLTGLVESIYADKREAFATYLEMKYTSYDGSSSECSNDIDEWEESFRETGIADSDHVVCGIYLSFWMQQQHQELGSGESLELDLYYSISDNLGNYVESNWEYEFPAIIDTLYDLDHPCTVEVLPPDEPGMPSASRRFEYTNSTIDTYCEIVSYFNSLPRYIPSDTELVLVEGSISIECPGQLALPL